jgi:sugar lactone lactonase YvrE
MAELRTLMEGLTIGESPRWHDDRLWLCNWGHGEVIAVGQDGRSEVVRQVPTGFQFSIDWLPDGRLLVVSGAERRLLTLEPGGSLNPYSDLRAVSDNGWNELVVDGRGNAYVNGAGFDVMAGEEFAPGQVALVTPDGAARAVAGGVAFPNGMAVTPDNSTLIVAESYGKKLTAFEIADDGSLSAGRPWALLDEGVPDGICIDATGAVWYADVPNKRCVRVREGGEVLDTIDVDRGCFACMLGGSDGRTLFIVAAEWGGMSGATAGPPSGVVLSAPAPAAAAGWP